MKLWKNNKLSEEWSLPKSEIIQLFKKSGIYKNKDLLEHIGEERSLRKFIGSPAEDGLCSTFDEDDFQQLFQEYLVSNIDFGTTLTAEGVIAVAKKTQKGTISPNNNKSRTSK